MPRTEAEQKRESDIKQLIQDADENVLKRAQFEAFEFTLEAPGLIRVTNGSHANPDDHSYVVNIEKGIPVACECPHFQYNDVDLCKHGAAVAIREPVMQAAQRPQEVVSIPDGGPTLEYTYHYERTEQGAKEYVRCGGCGRELLTELGGQDSLPHREGCPNGGDT